VPSSWGRLRRARSPRRRSSPSASPPNPSNSVAAAEIPRSSRDGERVSRSCARWRSRAAGARWRSRGSLHPHRGGVGAAAPVRVSAGLSPRRRPLLGDLDGGPPPSLPVSSLPSHLAISFRLHARTADPLLWPREVGSARGVAHVRKSTGFGGYGLRAGRRVRLPVPRCGGGGGGTPMTYWSRLWRTPPSTQCDQPDPCSFTVVS
jgi:hypothetical protein